MSNSGPTIVNVSQPSANPSDELTHVTQEMYKKNSELNDRNKTLALLRKIDEIVLSAVTDLRQVAQQISDLLAEERFQMVSLHILKDTLLIPFAISSTGSSVIINQYGRDRFLSPPISLLDKDNLLIKAVEDKKIHTAINLQDVLSKNISPEESKAIQEKIGIKSIIVYPLIVRLEIIGVLIIGITEEEKEITADNKAFIDRMAGVVGIALDNSLLYQSIQEENERLKQVDKLKDEFVSLASHELRTPMTIIKSYLWMFLDKKKGELNQKEITYLERAYSSTERLIKLVNDMLNVSRIESGRLKLEMKDVEIVSLIDTVVTELVPRAQELEIKLVNNKPLKPVGVLNADAERIEQILINLIGNSLKFTPQGGSITVSLTPKEKEVLISVLDTGRGIKKEDMPTLFQKFGMIGGAYLQKQQNQGSGLGLYISKSLVELHGGKIWVQSGGENKGTMFSFTLPYNIDKPHQEAAVLPAAPPIPVPAAGAPSAVK